MPKKFKGTNTKSEEARARKEAVRIAEKERKQKEEEDKFWEDNDKHVVRKQHRKDEKDRKRQEAAERKAANREALDAEESSLKKDSGVRTKMTMAEIQAVNAREKKADAVAASAAKKNKKEESISEKLEENPNQQMAELMAAEGAVEARSVEEAIAVLGVAEAPVERHPEKRMKAAFSAFEERELPRLKQENPNLRLSQLKQLLKKEWLKSPENPMNMAFSQYNEKKS